MTQLTRKDWLTRQIRSLDKIPDNFPHLLLISKPRRRAKDENKCL